MPRMRPAIEARLMLPAEAAAVSMRPVLATPPTETQEMIKKLYVATTNPGKLRDFAVAAQLHNFSIEPLPGLEAIPPAPEDEPTFEGNACAKALYYSCFLPGETVLADDSGLEVEVLDGAPGVRSARYAADFGFLSDSQDSVDVRNNLFLLKQLSGIPEAQRQGRYFCALAAAQSSKILHTAYGYVRGLILTAPRGAGGFGYDPLFYLPHLKRTMAEIDLQTKAELSHRGNALRALLAKFPVERPA
jgi:XTP/dITP diphosphohydrolase